jgi:phenylpyruvate tautomerase PptA (4-oxalocrotonate tautomerase family)
VLKARVPPPAAQQEEVDRLTAAVAAICDRPPQNVHVIYAPAAAGRVAFGGVMIVD